MFKKYFYIKKIQLFIKVKTLNNYFTKTFMD